MKKAKEEATEGVPAKRRRKFDPLFKEETVAMWLKSGKSARQISSELGISESRLFEWKKQYGPVSLASKAEQETELASLRPHLGQSPPPTRRPLSSHRRRRRRLTLYIFLFLLLLLDP